MIPQDQQVKHHDESRTKDSKLDTTQKKKEKDGEKITLRRLQKPVFDSSLYKKNDGTVSGSLLTVDAEEPFLCTPLDITESNLLAWLMRDSNKGSTHGNEGGEKYEKPLPDHIIEGEKARYASEEAKELYRSDRDYHNRRELNRILASRLELGTSIIDEDGRLLPVPNNDENNNDDDGNSNSTTDENLDEIEGGDENRDNDDINDENQVIHEEVDHGFFPAVFGNAAQEWLDEEEERRRHIQRQEQDAEEVIALAVKKYRDDEVPEDSFIFIPIPSRIHEEINLTIRRILVAVGCVLAAFVCVLMQAFDFIESDVVKTDPKFDELLYDLLKVRPFSDHVKECRGLQRNGYVKVSTKRYKKIDCGDGVLHIPSIKVLSKLDENATVDEGLIKLGLHEVYHPYKNGVNVSWFHECALENPPNSTCVLQRQYPSDDESEQSKDTCAETEEVPPVACFRGVHDGIITESEVESLLELGELLIAEGGDHLTIYYDVKPLIENASAVLAKLESLLRYKYATPKIKPVAFQISVASPISFSSSTQAAKGTHRDSILKARNQTIYKKWFNQVQMINSWPKFVIPISTPYRDQCFLVSDLEAREDFAFHTSVYLADGAGEDFSGGVSLFVDNHQTNINLRNRVQRGVTVDGSRGRIVLNSGSEDNSRCRLPMRSGLRAELDIWWNCIT